ncbi:MAG: orotate phosphoribosyltransferase [Myxococcales bacterium]|nr:orotate phosphoribosyltransferase [Myxococcales bacterium]MCB9713392.1 orotate phosphoribosyltransferase [Myxococcales bacterium]
MEVFQQDFVDLLVEYEVVRFGEFTLKSGRRSPYFVNAGQLRTGDAIARLGRAYAGQLLHHRIPCDLVFGPSYKGVPLAVATASGLAARGHDTGFCFDRKEVKDHGEGGSFVGMAPTDGMRVVIVDDVITSGQSIREAAELLRSSAKVELSAVVIAVDRQERGKSERSTLAELRDELGAPILPLVTVRQLVDDLHSRTVGGRQIIDDASKAAIEAYLAEHGAREP